MSPSGEQKAYDTAIRYSCHLRRTRLYGLTAAILVAPSLSGCANSVSTSGNPPTLNTVTVEHAVAASILTQHHINASVSCPSKVPRKTGVVFTCTASLNVGTYPVSVTETNNSGRVKYQNQAPLAALNIAKVERAIKQSISTTQHRDSTVTCPAEVIQKKGIVFTCTAKGNSQSCPFEVTEVDDNGHVSYAGR